MSNNADHEYAETIRAYLSTLSDDKTKVEEITGILINRSYDHFLLFFAENPDRLKSMQKWVKVNHESIGG